MKPAELIEAEIIDGLCRRYGCPPSVILAEEASILQMLAIVTMGQSQEG